MGAHFHRLTITEQERVEVGSWPMIHGKGTVKNDLVYFQLDVNTLRSAQKKNMRVGGKINIVDEDILGGTGAFAVAS